MYIVCRPPLQPPISYSVLHVLVGRGRSGDTSWESAREEETQQGNGEGEEGRMSELGSLNPKSEWCMLQIMQIV